ncbi:MAG: response regulator, partial [Acholeplasmatales bacterium]|nr:response regulator [Acholeplasmatales bacterium]
PVKTVGGWVLLSYIENDKLAVNNDNFILVGVVSIGLLMLFVIDLIYLRHFYIKLKYLSKQAEKANKSKTDFLSTMSHDIRTPMNAIVGLTVLTEKNIDNKDLVKEYNKKISLASNHLLTLINDILDISKVESGKIFLNPISFSIIELIDNLVNITEPMIKDKNIDFKLNLNDINHEYLFADKLRLNQIFMNILSNAIKYTEVSGSISVDLIEEETDNPNYVKLIYIVKDTGIGMSKEFMEKMYDPFIRETDSRINRIEGTGLGLAITKKMVDLMEGTIECESKEGVGTTFKISLDIKKDLEKNNKEVNDLSNDYSIIANMNILIAEDNDINYEIISEMLKSYNINTFRAIDGQECLDIIKKSRENEYDLIFMDIQMPKKNGLEVTKEIRLLDNWAKDIPIIAMTADAFSENINECLSVGMNGHIAKPIDINIVLNEIRKIKEGAK